MASPSVAKATLTLTPLRLRVFDTSPCPVDTGLRRPSALPQLGVVADRLCGFDRGVFRQVWPGLLEYFYLAVPCVAMQAVEWWAFDSPAAGGEAFQGPGVAIVEVCCL